MILINFFTDIYVSTVSQGKVGTRKGNVGKKHLYGLYSQ